MKKFLCFLLIMFFTALLIIPPVYVLVCYYKGATWLGVMVGIISWVQLVIIVTAIKEWIEKIFDIKY